MWAVRYLFILLHKRHNENVLYGGFIQLYHPLACYQQRIFSGSNVYGLHVGYSLEPAAAAPRITLNNVQIVP